MGLAVATLGLGLVLPVFLSPPLQEWTAVRGAVLLNLLQVCGRLAPHTEVVDVSA